MSMTQALVVYAIVFFILLVIALVLLLRGKNLGKKIPIRLHWQKIVVIKPFVATDGEFWFKISLATLIAFCGGVALVAFILPFGSGWVLIALPAFFLVLSLFLPSFLS